MSTIAHMHGWDKYSKEYPFHAEAPTSIKPTLVELEEACKPFACVKSRIGWRIWGFKTREARDRFTMQFGGIKIGEG